MKKFFYRIYQKALFISMFLMPVPKPKIFRGYDAYLSLEKIFDKQHKVLIVTDAFLANHPTTHKIKAYFESLQIHYEVFDQAKPDPKVHEVIQAKDFYMKSHCNAILAIGGGSSIDLGKAIGVLVVKPNKSFHKLKGILKVRKKLPLLVAIPTTVGTGSEATLASVVTDADTREKFAIMDHALVPKYAIMEYSYIDGLPKRLVASTGLDALTHAIEAYIGKSNTRKTKQYALRAIKIIFDHLKLAYDGNIESKTQMLEASHLAGLAFTSAYVGNVHAVAHTLGGFYHIEHGLANAVVLPYVLKYYDKKIYKKMAKIHDYLFDQKALTHAQKHEKVLCEISRLSTELDMPKGFYDMIIDEDIPKMIALALKEANPLYPVPMIFSWKDFEYIYNQIKKEN